MSHYKHGVKNPIQAGDGDPRHGKPSSYRFHKCRCEACSVAYYEANRANFKAWWERTGRAQRAARREAQ